MVGKGGMDDDMHDNERPQKAGSIRRISVENFMCHSNLTIELGDRVNFITGQNGSGKSAILTALCVAFGIKARGTQRASSIKDFIKSGCRYGLVVVELNNVGEDAFKPAVFGDRILVERRILESSTAFCLKDSRGKKVGSRKEDILEVVDHFNIEVENPCVIMTQDKSREFLHGGNDKDKFKFYLKATLLQAFSELLTEWEATLDTTTDVVRGGMSSLQPDKDAMKVIDDQLKTLEQVEVLRSEIEKLEKFYAWSWVEDATQDLKEAENKLEDLKNRIPICQKKIDDAQLKVALKREAHAEKKALIARMINDTQELRKFQTTLQMAFKEASGEKIQAEENVNRLRPSIQETRSRLHRFERDISEMQQRMFQDTQAELNEKLEEIQALENNKRADQEECKRLHEEESVVNSELVDYGQSKAALNKEVEDYKSQLRDLANHIRALQSRQTNTVTAFGGESVLRLLKAIEENRNRFTRPPLGPIGAHLGLVDGDWSLAVEVAIGMMLNSFTVSNQHDMLLLRDIGNRVGCHNLGIYIARFDRPLIQPKANDLPDGSLLTVMGSLECESATIMNVLIDQGGIEQKVLVQDYNAGKNIAFSSGPPSMNVREVITMDGTRMYTRAGAETTLPRDRKIRGGRLGVRVDEQIIQAQVQECELNSGIQEAETRKRKVDQEVLRAREIADTLKRRRTDWERDLRRQEFKILDLRNAITNEPDLNKESLMIELEQETWKTREEIQSKEDALHKAEFKLELAKSKWADAKSQLEQLCESARGDFTSLHLSEQDLVTLENDIEEADKMVAHWKRVMEQKVVLEIQNQEKILEAKHQAVEKLRDQASQICPKEEREPLGEDRRTPEQLSNQIKRLRERANRQENETESHQVLFKRGNKLRRRIAAKEMKFHDLREKLDTLKEALEKRKKRYRRNCLNLKRELTWGFNANLGRKGFSGHVTVDYENKTLNMSVQMPQDASNTAVRDTRALSGGERSYSTLAFALAVHNMTEAPFRAMDEFDVFMDAVSRKISLDTVVDFALQEGSQWIFITPHDISMVKGTKHVKKQQMPAPRP